MQKLGQKDYNPESIIFQRLQNEEALDELQRKEARLRFARNVRTIWGERTFLVRLALLGFVLGLIIAFLIPTRFTSATKLMPPDNQSGSSLAMAAISMASSRAGAGGVGGGLGEIAGDLLGLKSTSDMFVGILGSRTVQDELIQQFNLRHVYGYRKMETTRKELASRTGISIDRKSQIITITVTDHSPERAAAMAKAYVDQLNRLVAELSTSSARRERIFLEGRLVQVNQDLENAEKEFSQYSSKNGAIDIKEQGKAMVEAAATLQGRLIFAQSELEGLRQIYSDSNVRVRAVKARIEELQSQLNKIGGKGQSTTLGPDSGAADLYPSIRKLPLLGVEYADLYRRTKVQEAVYEALTQEYELAKVQEAKEIPTVKVLDVADVPETKSFPPRILMAILGMFVALIGGVMFLLGSKSWNEKDPHDLGKAIATEIWIDLKEKRLLNPVNGSGHEAQENGLHPPPKRRSILSFLGLKNGAGPSQKEVTEEEHSKKES
jgi:capsule polysaccharide export protein KpsE/RkpR